MLKGFTTVTSGGSLGSQSYTIENGYYIVREILLQRFKIRWVGWSNALWVIIICKLINLQKVGV